VTPQLILGVVALVVSHTFKLLQYRWRKEERASRIKEKEEARIEQQRKEQTPPMVYNYDGSPDPILVSGKSDSVDGSMKHLYCLVTVVNSTQAPMKIVPIRLVLGSQEWPLNFFFRLKDGPTRERLRKISLRGNEKNDYELNFLFQPSSCPESMQCEFWLSSDNRSEPFAVKVKFS
jgi:hypothetical protein